MSPVTHFFSGWVLANCANLSRKDRALVTLACVIPDIDGLGIIPEILTRNSAHPLLWFTLYHHALHNLAFRLGGHCCGICSCNTQVGHRTARSSELPPASVRGSARIAWPRWLSMADPVSAAVLLRSATRLERAMGFECVAECGAYDWAVVPHALAGVASRVLAPGNDLRQSGRVSGCGASSTLSRRKSDLRRDKPWRESDRRVAQAFELAGIGNEAGAPSFAFFAKVGVGNAGCKFVDPCRVVTNQVVHAASPPTLEVIETGRLERCS